MTRVTDNEREELRKLIAQARELVAALESEREASRAERVSRAAPAVPAPPPVSTGEKRKRASRALWGTGKLDESEHRALTSVEKICVSAKTREARKRKLDDACRYEFSVVARAISDVELRAAGRGEPYRSREANFWEAVTNPRHGFVEGATANWKSTAELVELERVARVPARAGNLRDDRVAAPLPTYGRLTKPPAWADGESGGDA